MTYFGVLGVFVLPPLGVLLALVPRDIWRWRFKRAQRVNWSPYLIVLLHVGLALAYTTPWDNYLVANGVWWYDPALVTGITFGWVPLEEYTFFILQTLLTGFWTLAVWRALGPFESPFLLQKARWGLAGVVLLIGVVSTGLWVGNWQAGTYLTLIVSWASVPLLIQVTFGGDILLANWRSLILAVVPPTLYLWIVDAIAIRSGTWTIDPQQTLGLKLGPLPVEEMLFFFLTNLLIVCGITLISTDEGKKRVVFWFNFLKRSLRGPSTGKRMQTRLR